MRRKIYQTLSKLILSLTVLALIVVIVNFYNGVSSEETDSLIALRSIHTNTETSGPGEQGSEVILSDLEEKTHRNEIKKGWKDYAFNEYVSSLISLGKLAGSALLGTI